MTSLELLTIVWSCQELIRRTSGDPKRRRTKHDLVFLRYSRIYDFRPANQSQ